MRQRSFHRTLPVLAIGLLLPGGALAQDDPETHPGEITDRPSMAGDTIDPDTIRLEDLPALDTLPDPEEDPYEVGRARPPVDDDASVRQLTLEEAIEIALDRNLNLQSARLDPEAQRHSLAGARAAYRPMLTASTSYQDATSPSTSQLDGGEQVESQQNTANVSLSQDVPWYGGDFSVGFNNSRSETTNAFATRNPSYSTSLSLSYSQPLLSGRSIDGTRNQIRNQEIWRDITDLQLEEEERNLAAQVRQAYWNLRSQIEQVEIQKRNLAQAQRLLAENRLRVEQGTMVEMELAQAEAQVASAQQDLLAAEIQWENQERDFKTLLVRGSQDPLMQEHIEPVDLPDYEEPDVDLAAAISQALDRRVDLETQRRQYRISENNLELARDNTRPSLNLNASYSLQGVGGNVFRRDDFGGEGELVERGGYVDGLTDITRFQTPTFQIGLSLSRPLGTSAQDANLEEARVQQRQAEMNLQAQELQIETQVTNAGRALENAYQQIRAAERSREMAERSLEAELTRFSVGASTNFQVVAAQDTLTEARLSELLAIINYVNAMTDFQLATGEAVF